MLIQFKVRNFLSFKEEQLFSMAASNLTELPGNRLEIAQDDFYLLKTASIFGANASGKSNLLKALKFMRDFVLNSFKDSQDDSDIPLNPFALNIRSKEADSLLELTFLAQNWLVRYGFEAGKRAVTHEWLYIDEEPVFERAGSQLTYANADYLDGDETSLKFKMTNARSLFLTVLSTTNTAFAKVLADYFRYKLVFVHGLGGGSGNYTKRMLKDARYTDRIIAMLKMADLNINHLELEAKRLLTTHHVYDDAGHIVGAYQFDSEIFESSGTNEFLAIAGPIIDALFAGSVLFIDEMDAQLHPMMAQHILGLFHSEENTKNAQLIITTHNAALLNGSVLRRDQIWFVEKDTVEASHLTSLCNYRFKGEVVRKEERYDRNYLKGKYGAVPIVREEFAEYIFDDKTEDVDGKEA